MTRNIYRNVTGEELQLQYISNTNVTTQWAITWYFNTMHGTTRTIQVTGLKHRKTGIWL